MENNYVLKEGIFCHVPVDALIEDYRGLMEAKKFMCDDIRRADGLLTSVMMCIGEAISRYTESYQTKFKISESTLIAPSCDNGIVITEDGHDVECAAGKGVSDAYYQGCCQCPEECPHRKGDNPCNPENGKFLLKNGFLYDMAEGSANDEKLLDSLEKE